MTSSHHGPYDQGYTRATMAHTKRSDLARASGPHKVRRSPDWSLGLVFWDWLPLAGWQPFVLAIVTRV